jgi:two-component system sensor kinase FixL
VLGRARRRFEIEYDCVHGLGKETYATTMEALERDEGGAVVMRDNITARRLIQTEIEMHRLELSHLARVSVLGQLSGAFAHELNQPLTVILSNAETARRLIRHGSPDLASLDEILLEVITADQRAASMIQRLGNLLKRGDLRVAPIDIKELIDEVLGLANTELIRRQVGVRLRVDPALPPIWGDKIQLQQVLLNLILNGIEAMNTVAVANRQIDLTAGLDPAAGVHLAVRDTGRGISAELIERLFEPFVTSKADGLGLGLSISRTIIAAHGGRIWGLNNPEGGATIHCVLPVTQPAPPPVGRLKQPAAGALER